jgi:outer membrane lipoprotein carrier protein
MLLRLVAAMLFALSFVQQALCADDIAAVLDGLKKRYGGASALTLPYSRETITRTMTMLPGKVRGDLASGILYFRPPYYMRMEQEKPEPETLLSDGERIWWHVPAKNLVQVYPFQRSGKEFLLLSDVLRGLSDVGERFTTSLLPSQGNNGNLLLELKPEPPWEEIERIVLEVTKDNRIAVVLIHNRLGGITRFELGEAHSTKDLPQSLFQFTPPPGCKVVEEANQ